MQRTKEYAKDQTQELSLQLLNKYLASTELELIDNFDTPELPQIFIIGAPRAATTLMHQVLAKSSYFGYISNYIARYWEAPYFAALQGKMLDIYGKQIIQFESDFGRTNGWIEPHQFNYFWKKWLEYDENHQMSTENLITRNSTLFLKELHALENFFAKPLVFKSLYTGLQVNLLKKVLPNSKFVVMNRDPLYQAQSIFLARKSFFNDINGWFSLKPKEYFELIKLNPYDQIAGQIFYILSHIFIHFLVML